MATLADIRASLADQVDSDPAPSTDWVRRVNGFINRAYVSLVDEIPFAFHEEVIRLGTVALASSKTNSDTLSAYSVTQRRVAEDTFDATTVSLARSSYWKSDLAQSSSNATQWKLDRTWDGRSIELLNPTTNAVVHRTRIRGIVSGSDEIIRVSFVEPVDTDAVGTGPFKWRVYDQHLYLPSDVIEVRNVRCLEDTTPYNIEILGQTESEDRWLTYDQDSLVGGVPRYMFSRGWSQPLRAPALPLALTDATTDPDLSASTGYWTGPEPPGIFSYKYTLTWGKRPLNVSTGIPYPEHDGRIFRWEDSALINDFTQAQGGQGRLLEPLFESAPSPASAQFTVTIPSGGTAVPDAPVLVFPNWAYMLGYWGEMTQGNSSTNEFVLPEVQGFLSGLYVRVYRRRHSVDLSNYDLYGDGKSSITYRVDGIHALDYDDSYYLLAELPVLERTNAGLAKWVDNGTLFPDPTVRVKDRTGYRAYRLHPTPDAEYEINARCLLRPDPLENDRDSIRLPSDATDLVIYKAMTYYYEHLHNPGAAARAEQLYEKELRALRARYGDLRPDNEVIFRRPARSKSNGYIGRRWWKRTT